MPPKISVTINTYNTGKYFDRAVRSVLNQTFQDFEIVVVDDGSTDSTLEDIQKVRDEVKDDRIKLFALKKNIGLSAARNIAISEAKGTWIAILDSDDWYAPQRLEKLLELAKSHDADMVADDLNLTQLNDTKVWSTWFKENGQVIEDPLTVDPACFARTDQYGQRGLHMGLTKPMFKRSFLLEHNLNYDEDNKFTQDFWFYLSCLIKGAKFVVTSEAYYFQFFRLGSLMRSSQIKRLSKDIETAEAFLSSEVIQQDPDLVAAIRTNLKLYRQYIGYYQVAEPLKARNWPLALKSMVQYPIFFWHFSRKLPAIVLLRVERYLGIQSNARNSMLSS